MQRLTIVFLLFFVPTLASRTLSAQQPHIQRQGRNLLVNPAVSGIANRSLVRGATYDPNNSRTNDGSGSIKLVKPRPRANLSASALVPVKSGKLYTYGFYFKVANGPTYVGGQISLHDSKGKFIRNHVSTLGGTTWDGDWQEYALPFVVPEGVSFVGCEVYKGENTKPNGIVWADDFYLGEGLGLDQPPSPKRPFNGAHVKVDQLGNFEIRKRGVWTAFFPLCIYSDNRRDWSLYSEQGWNTVTWTGAAHQIKQAKDAVSEFNPDGMLAGFHISPYTNPKGWAYGNLDGLRDKLKDIFDQRLDENLLFYYWDNEVHHDQWEVPSKVINTIKSFDIDDSRKRLHPVYALQGTYNNARTHAACGLVDVSGTYFNGNADVVGEELSGHEGLFVLDRMHGQVSPAAMAQFNNVNGAGDMRLRLYNSILLGARGMGYWRDCFSCDDKFMKTVGPVDEKLWWPDFPNLRREVDALLPLIRQPHWTAWQAVQNKPNVVRVGTRDLNGIAHMILVNQTTRLQEVLVQVDGLSYEPREVHDCLRGERVAAVNNRSFLIKLPPIGIGSGTAILRLMP